MISGKSTLQYAPERVIREFISADHQTAANFDTVESFIMFL